MKRVRIYLMGGTIAAHLDSEGNAVTADLEDYVKGLREFDGKADVDVCSFSRLGGYETEFSHVLSLAGEINRAAREDGLDGLVVVMGTNVMEEIAFALHLLAPVRVPLVITGAMRTAFAKSADGPHNLICAVAAAADPALCGMGALVVMNDVIHSAQYVRKVHASNVAAFQSDFPVGYMVEGKASVRVRPIRRPIPWIAPKDIRKDVLLYESCFSDTGRILDAIPQIPYDGIVIDGTGSGSIPGWVLDKVERLHRIMPVVIASRTGCGDVLTATYGHGYGTPEYYVEKGYLIAGMLDGRKARVLLALLLMSGCSGEQLAESFRRYSRDYAEED